MYWFPVLTAWLFILNTPDRAYPQTDDQSCTTLVQTALQTASGACQGATADSICLGYPLAAVTFNIDSTPRPFTATGDHVDLSDMLAVATQAANPITHTWGIVSATIGADNPLRYTLIGEASLTTATPNLPPAPTCQVSNSSGGNVNIRSAPSTTAAVVGQMTVSEVTTAIGRNTAGDWYQIEHLGVTGWVFASLLTGDCGLLAEVDLAAPPSPKFLQTATLRTGESSACPTAPNGLLVQAPADTAIEVVINEVPIVVSGVAFITAPESDGLRLTSLAGTTSGGGMALLPGFGTTIVEGNATPPQPTQRDDLLGMVVETLVYGDQRGVARQSLATIECAIGDSFVVDVPFSRPRDYDMTVAISYLSGSDSGVVAAFVNLKDFRITCQQVGTYQLALSIRYGDGTGGEVFVYTFAVNQP